MQGRCRRTYNRGILCTHVHRPSAVSFLSAIPFPRALYRPFRFFRICPFADTPMSLLLAPSTSSPFPSIILARVVPVKLPVADASKTQRKRLVTPSNRVYAVTRGLWQEYTDHLIKVIPVESPEKSYSRPGPCFHGNINHTAGHTFLCFRVSIIFPFEKSTPGDAQASCDIALGQTQCRSSSFHHFLFCLAFLRIRQDRLCHGSRNTKVAIRCKTSSANRRCVTCSTSSTVGETGARLTWQRPIKVGGFSRDTLAKKHASEIPRVNASRDTIERCASDNRYCYENNKRAAIRALDATNDYDFLEAMHADYIHSWKAF